jgi:hypothetical protein
VSWLRDHFHELVFPAFVAAEKKTTDIGKPFHIQPSRHAPTRLPTELKKLWTLCMEHGVEWSYDIRDRNTHGGNSKFRDSAKLHHTMLRSTLEATIVAMRVEGCDRVLLPGRDIWLLAILCARHRVPFLFVPELSRKVSEQPQVRKLLESRGLTGRELLVDTGYIGSIPANLKKFIPGFEFAFRLISHVDNGDRSLSKAERRPKQLFPHRATAREEAIESEYLAKYWRGGSYDAKGEVVQYFSDRASIQRAALLTSMLFRGIPFWKVPAPPKGVYNGVWYKGAGGVQNFTAAQAQKALGLNPIHSTINVVSTSTVATSTSVTTFGSIIGPGFTIQPVGPLGAMVFAPTPPPAPPPPPPAPVLASPRALADVLMNALRAAPPLLLPPASRAGVVVDHA